VRIIRGFFRSLVRRKIETPDERLAWLLGIATIPAGIVGLALEHKLRTQFAKPLAASIFLTVNGLILLAGEQVRRRAGTQQRVMASTTPSQGTGPEPGRQLDTLEYRESVVIGVAQIAALFAGISRSGVTMVAGLVRGLNHEDAARFSFLLATPLIFAAGLYKVPDLLGPLGNGVRAQALVGAVFSGVAAYLSTKFLIKFFETRSLLPFGIYCLVAGGLCILRFA
jgi:undecaprenyl-diphosphatase